MTNNDCRHTQIFNRPTVQILGLKSTICKISGIYRIQEYKRIHISQSQHSFNSQLASSATTNV